MNNPKLNNLTEQLRQAHLTESEKTELREKLLTFMSAHPAPANAAPSGFWLLRQRSLSFSLTLALILIVTVSSVSYAAEFSLPGEPLYGLKVNLTEPLRGTLKNNPQAQAEWNNTLVERRLTEAQILADTGHLAGEADVLILSVLGVINGLISLIKAILSSWKGTPPFKTFTCLARDALPVKISTSA
jgi:hypothetical protein